MPREYPTVLDLVGDTPIVRLQKLGRPGGAGAARQARVPEPRRLGEGPDRPRADRGGRARREAEARRHDRRAHLRQHGRRPCDRRGDQGLPLHLRDAGQDEPGEDLDAPGLRRRGRDHADRGRPRLARELLLRLRPPRRGDPRRLQARPVLEPRQPDRALRADRARALGADRRRRARRGRDLRRHRRHDHRRRPLLQGAPAGGADRRRRPGGLGLHGGRRPPGASVPRRGDRQGHLARDARPVRRGRVDPRLRPRLVPHRTAARAGRGDSLGRLGRDDGVGGTPGRQALRPGSAGSSR